MPRQTASYSGLVPASTRASASARGASRKADTQPEMRLRKAIHRRGLRFRKNVRALPGCPDIVFSGPKVAVFCDGDFWHGRSWSERKAKLLRGTNGSYWIAKIERNMDRDIEVQEQLERRGWRVLRFWESDISNDLTTIVGDVEGAVRGDE